MKTLSTTLVKAKNLEIYPWVELVTFEFTSEPMRFTNNNEDVVYAGNTYVPADFILDTTVETMNGNIPTISLSMQNVYKAFNAILDSEGGLRGCTVTLDRVNVQYLTEDYSLLQHVFTVLGCVVNDYTIKFTLGGRNLIRQRSPQYRYMSTSCNWKDTNCECGYKIANPTADPCGRTYDDCEDRGQTAYFGGHRGLSDKNYRII